MQKNKKFMLRLSPKDYQVLSDISVATQRSKSDSIRWALNEVAKAINDHPEKLRMLKQAKLSA